MKMLLTILLAVLFFGGIAGAACPSSGADVNGDCEVNLEDFAIISLGWLVTFDINDLATMVSEWQDIDESVPGLIGITWILLSRQQAFYLGQVFLGIDPCRGPAEGSGHPDLESDRKGA